ncbi:hypothetical protein V8F33_003846 [Rhypophila sp. PSN 637]
MYARWHLITLITRVALFHPRVSWEARQQFGSRFIWRVLLAVHLRPGEKMHGRRNGVRAIAPQMELTWIRLRREKRETDTLPYQRQPHLLFDTFIFVVLRTYTRLVVVQNFGMDDHVHSLRLLLLMYTIMTTISAHYGFGQNMGDIADIEDLIQAILFESHRSDICRRRHGSCKVVTGPLPATPCHRDLA